MTDFKKRVDRIENILEATEGDKYREICLSYNLMFLSDEDLQELIEAIYGRRPINPETEKRAYAPIPPDAPAHLIKEAEAKALMHFEVSDEDLKGIMDKYLEDKHEFEKQTEQNRIGA
jgi:hypothetical protein